jgi:hypothetical protein
MAAPPRKFLQVRVTAGIIKCTVLYFAVLFNQPLRAGVERSSGVHRAHMQGLQLAMVLASCSRSAIVKFN